jgi:hypothetical protein
MSKADRDWHEDIVDGDEIVRDIDGGLTAVHDKKGIYMMLFGGAKYYPDNPGDFTIGVEDYAQALSLQCRYGGHAVFHYSVAQHQLLMAQYILGKHRNIDMALAALHHDGSESVLIDVPRPLKPFMGGYYEIEAVAQKRIYEVFGVPFDEPPAEVKEADNLILYNEAKVLHPFADWWEHFSPGLEGVEVRERAWRDVREDFIDYHYHLKEMQQQDVF